MKLDCMTDPDFRNAFYAHKDVVYRFVYRMTGSANGAEDIVQECFLALWRKPDAYRPRSRRPAAISARDRPQPGAQTLEGRASVRLD